jgi:hypothetical protein
VGWKAPPPTDPWQDEEPPKADQWLTLSVMIGVIAIALIALIVVGAVYVYLVVSRGAG